MRTIGGPAVKRLVRVIGMLGPSISASATSGPGAVRAVYRNLGTMRESSC